LFILNAAHADLIQREKQGGRRGPQPESVPYGDPYAQHAQPYGQPAPQHMPPQHMPAPAGPEAVADPYAAYGGYQNYMAMWYAAVANQPGGGPPPV